MITVLVVDDHALVRRGFRRLLEDEPDIEVVGEAGNGREAVELTSKLKPQIVVMDYAMPELDGVHPRVFITKAEIEQLRLRARTTHRDLWQPVLTKLAAMQGADLSALAQPVK